MYLVVVVVVLHRKSVICSRTIRWSSCCFCRRFKCRVYLLGFRWLVASSHQFVLLPSGLSDPMLLAANVGWPHVGRRRRCGHGVVIGVGRVRGDQLSSLVEGRWQRPVVGVIGADWGCPGRGSSPRRTSLGSPRRAHECCSRVFRVGVIRCWGGATSWNVNLVLKIEFGVVF